MKQSRNQSKERRTALVLSGGGSRGAYQCGVWRAMTELGMDIDIVIGVSVGAINGAMVVQGDVIRTASLWREMETDMVFDVDADAQLADFAREFFRDRGAGSSGLQTLLHQYVDETAVRRSPVDFGLLTVEFPSMKPHYLWKEDIPEGKLCDYITASASAFPAVKTFDIDGHSYIDGGYEDNLPAAMALEKGATDIVCVYLDAIGRFRPSELKDLPNLTFIESRWNLGDFLVFDRANSKRILRLGYLDAMKIFGVFDGGYYTFVKGSFDRRTLRQADDAARIFELDPLILYSREVFAEKLGDAVSRAIAEEKLSLSAAEMSALSRSGLSKAVEELKSAGRKAAVLFIADSLREKGGESIFLSRYASRLLREEVSAAKMLMKQGLV
ncbi:MAG: patatin-like phospholipase family protein [Emergencia sp.]